MGNVEKLSVAAELIIFTFSERGGTELVWIDARLKIQGQDTNSQ